MSSNGRGHRGDGQGRNAVSHGDQHQKISFTRPVDPSTLVVMHPRQPIDTPTQIIHIAADDPAMKMTRSYEEEPEGEGERLCRESLQKWQAEQVEQAKRAKQTEQAKGHEIDSPLPPIPPAERNQTIPSPSSSRMPTAPNDSSMRGYTDIKSPQAGPSSTSSIPREYEELLRNAEHQNTEILATNLRIAPETVNMRLKKAYKIKAKQLNVPYNTVADEHVELRYRNGAITRESYFRWKTGMERVAESEGQEL